MALHEIKLEELKIDPFVYFKTDWVLITAGDKEKANTMTASWGGVGEIWGKAAATVYIRPQRYTKEFVDKNECFSISQFSPEFKEKLAYLGKVSGRDTDKIKDSGLTLEYIDGVPYFKEARQVFIVRKLYADEIKEEKFADKSLCSQFYPNKDYHTLYIGEIIKVLCDN